MLLTTNINNTNTMIGLYSGTERIANWRINTDRAKQPDEYAMLLSNLFEHNQLKWSEVTGVALSSVVPPLTGTFVDLFERYFQVEPLVVTNKIKTGVKILIDSNGKTKELPLLEKQEVAEIIIDRIMDLLNNY